MAKYIVKCAAGGIRECLSDKCLDIFDLQDLINGWVEHVSIAPNVSVMCDEDGKRKQLAPSITIGGTTFVGDVYIGRLTNKGLIPVSETTLKGLGVLD